MGALALDAPQPGVVWYKIYAMTPPRAYMGKYGHARVIEDSVAVFSDPATAIARYLALITEQGGYDETGIAANRCTMVFLSAQNTPDAKARGRVVYRSNLAAKEKGRIHPNEKRLVLPATRAYGELVERTWPWWPTWIEGLEACIERGDITAEQAEIVRGRIAAAG